MQCPSSGRRYLFLFSLLGFIRVVINVVGFDNIIAVNRDSIRLQVFMQISSVSIMFDHYRFYEVFLPGIILLVCLFSSNLFLDRYINNIFERMITLKE